MFPQAYLPIFKGQHVVSVAVLDPGSGDFLTPRSGFQIRDLGWVKNQDLGYGMNNHIS
jgi:hypothetical protein